MQNKIGNKFEILDTTLRDGAQTPGIAWTLEQKVKIGKYLDKLGVNVIEFGFPIVSASEIKLGQMLRKAKIKAKLCGLARPEEKDIVAVFNSGAQRVNIFVSCSDIQTGAMNKSLNKEFAKTLKATELAKSKGLEVEITLMDAVRARPEMLFPFAKALEMKGAKILTLSDTVGTSDAFSTDKLFREMRLHTNLVLSAHMHNDRGQATATTLAALRAGARQVHVTVGGLGERAGNASLAEVVIGAHDQLMLKSTVQKERLGPVINIISKIGNFKLFEGAPITGARVHSHAAGLHIGALKAFSPFPPERVGRKTTILYGAGTGRKAVEELLLQLGKPVTPQNVQELVTYFKSHGEKGKVFTQTQAKKVIVRRSAKIK
ncbi:MAG: hypothetical protein PHQ98_02515 [Candidatus ainarchaeum sp.]|nr:hypothetical protein [Candidatus ainarchaeum sp.]